MHPIPKLPKLLYGGDYNPEQWPREVWLEDVRLMREAGVNMVSLAIFSWAWIQPAPDRFEFEWLDEVMDLLHANGIAVNLATATASPPAWLVKLHPEMLPVLADGSVLGHGGRQHYAPWSSAYRKYAAVLVRAIANRYGSHPALVSWHINNELACHVKESFDPETNSLWRAWVERRYGTPAAVNTAWNTAFWGQRYESFDEINAPRLAPTTLNPGMVLDWRRFSAEAFTDLVRMEKAILREITPHIPVNTNFVGWHDFPSIDHRAIAAELDYVSWDSYPDPSEGLHAVQKNALHHDFMRSLKPGVPYVLMEQATGAVNWRPFNQPRTSQQTRAFSHQAVARGADGVLFFQWRQSAAGGEQYHSGMVPITGLTVGGHENRTWTLTKQLGADLSGLEAVAGSTLTAEVALLVDYDSLWALQASSRPTGFNPITEAERVHAALWRRNVAVDVRHPEDDLSGYRVLIAPAQQLVSHKGIANLRKFVQNGGHLLFTLFCAVTDETMRIHAGGVPGGLTDIFGYAVEDWWPVAPVYVGQIQLAKADALSVNATASLTWTHFAEAGYATTAEVLATFADGELTGRPALTRQRHPTSSQTQTQDSSNSQNSHHSPTNQTAAPGSAWYVAAQLDTAGLESVIGQLLAEANLHGVAETPEGIEATLRVSPDGRRFLYLVNHTPVPATIALPGIAGTDLINGSHVSESVTLPPMGLTVIQSPHASA